MDNLPPLALSVRQPSAWAIMHGGKDVENRTPGSIRAGRMGPGRICIHAATGMTEAEYRYIAWKMQGIGVACPPPAELPRGAILGTVEVTGIVTQSDSPWFGGVAGLTLRDPCPLKTPIPARGALGYFHWEAGGALVAPAPWMAKYAATNLFGAMELQFRDPPRRPWPKP